VNPSEGERHQTGPAFESASPIAAGLKAHERRIAHRTAMMGAGPLPIELDVFCWGGFFFPLLWSLRYAVWRAFWPLLVIGLILPLPVGGGIPETVAIGMRALKVILTGIMVVVPLWLGVNGHRLAWAAAARRIEKGVREPKTVAEATNGQYWWLGFGIVIAVVSLALQLNALWVGLRSGNGGTLFLTADIGLTAVPLALAAYLSKTRGWLWSALENPSRPTHVST